MGPSGLWGHMGLKKRERSRPETIESVRQDRDSSACCESERASEVVSGLGLFTGKVAVFVIRGIILIKIVNICSYLSGSLVQSLFFFFSYLLRISYILAPLKIETFHFGSLI